MLESAAKSVSIPSGTSTLLVGSSTRRRSITFSVYIVGSVGNAGVEIKAGSPFTSNADDQACLALLNTGLSPVTLTTDIHGDIVQREWHAICSVNSLRVAVIEGLGRPGKEGDDA